MPSTFDQPEQILPFTFKLIMHGNERFISLPNGFMNDCDLNAFSVLITPTKQVPSVVVSCDSPKHRCA